MHRYSAFNRLEQYSGSMGGTVKKPPENFKGTVAEWGLLSYGKRNSIRNAVSIAANRKLWFQKNKERLNAEQRKIYAENPEKKNAKSVRNQVYNRKHHEANREALNAKKRAHYHEHSDTILAKQREHRIEKEKSFYEMFGEDGIQP